MPTSRDRPPGGSLGAGDIRLARDALKQPIVDLGSLSRVGSYRAFGDGQAVRTTKGDSIMQQEIVMSPTLTTMLLSVLSAMWSIQFAEAVEQEIRPGNNVVTVGEVSIMRGEDRILTVGKETKMVAIAVKNDWVGVEVIGIGKKPKGWVQARYLRRVGSIARLSKNVVFRKERLTSISGKVLHVTRSATENGCHLACAIQLLNGREVIVVDGWESPEYETIIRGSPVFSPDGERVAYTVGK